VQYKLVNAGTDTACADNSVANLSIQQRFDTDQAGGAYKDLAAFVWDPDVDPINDEFVAEVEVVETMAFTSDGTYADPGFMDNYHQRDSSHVVKVPGCNFDFGWRCYHTHWRWSGLADSIAVLFTAAPQHLGPEPPANAGFTNYPKVPASQTVKVLAVQDAIGESDPYEPFSLVNDQVLGTPANGGRDIVQWVVSESDAFAGKNGAGQADSKHYDQYNLNDWFFLE
jgi:hypothetical protein